MEFSANSSGFTGMTFQSDADLSGILLSAPPDGTFAVDRNGLVTSAGGDCIMSDGRSSRDLIGTEIAHVLCPSDHDKGRTHVEAAFESKQPMRIDHEDEARLIGFTLFPMADGTSLTVIVQDLTKLRGKEHSLRQERKFMDAVLDGFPGSFTVSDAEGRLVRWNDYHRDELVGKPEEEMAGIDALNVIHPDDRHDVAGRSQALLRDGMVEDGEARVLRQGGPDFCWRQISGRRIEVDGKPMVISVSVDITARKRAEELLRQSEERFRLLFEAHSAVMLIFDSYSGLIMDANKAAADFYGWSVEELRNMRIHQLNPYPPEVQSGLGESDSARSQNTFTFRHLLKDGSIREVDVFGNRIEIGGSALIYAIINDVTDRNRWASLTEFRLALYQDSGTMSVEARLKSVLDEAERQTMSDFSFFHFLDGGLDDADPRVWSSRMQEYMSKVGGDRYHHPLEESGYWGDAVRQRQTMIHNDFQSTVKSGGMHEAHPFIGRAIVVPIVRGGDVPAVLVLGNKPYPYDSEDALRVEAIADMVWDIVARKRARQSESKLQSALMHIQKMDLVGQLAGGIAHDFNNMLGVIIGNAETALTFGEPEEFIGTSLREILAAAERSAGLTGQLLAFARKQPAMPQVIDLNAAIEGILGMLGRLIGEEVTLIWEPDQHEASVRIDPFQVDQILTNLCVNARDAITGMGRIIISVHGRRLHQASYEHGSYKAAGEYVMLSVKDTGKGIERKHLGHIFEPFFTTKELGKGTGLGLSTVYGIVKQNNGFIEVDSEEWLGTEMRIFLPRHGTDVCRSEPGEVVQPVTTGSGTILLVEDEPDILKICKTMLEISGYFVLAAASPLDALAIVADHAGNIDLLLTDVVMPEMNGKELSNRILILRPEIRTLFMSGYAPNMVAEHGVPEDVNFIHKPFSIKELTSMVKGILQA
jgi:PAS domain S-box-containing protein